MYSEGFDDSCFLPHCACVCNQGSVSREEYDDLQTRFATAEKALADKQLKIDEMKMEIFQKEKELDTISVFQAQVQTIVISCHVLSLFFKLFTICIIYSVFFFCVHIQAEIYSSDFYAERAAREKIHEEKERLATQLEYVKKQNSQLQEEMESLGRYVINLTYPLTCDLCANFNRIVFMLQAFHDRDAKETCATWGQSTRPHISTQHARR